MRFYQYTIYILLYILIISSKNNPAHSQPTNYIRPDTLALARRLDHLQERFLLSPNTVSSGLNDHQTALGTIIDRSCFAGPLERLRPRTIERIERALNHAVIQIDNCDQKVRMPLVNTAISILRRTRIQCGNVGANALGSNSVFEYPPLTIGYGVNRVAYHRQQITLSNNITQLNALWYATPESLASTIFHETLHSLSFNNTTWHNRAGERLISGCRDSLFEDQIYLLQGFCFPQSELGRMLWSTRSYSALECPGLCERTFRPTPSSLPSWAINRPADHGPPTAPIRRTDRDVRHLCHQIRSAKREYDNTIGQLTREIESTRQAYERFFGEALTEVEWHRLQNNTAQQRVLDQEIRNAMRPLKLKISGLLTQISIGLEQQAPLHTTQQSCTTTQTEIFADIDRLCIQARYRPMLDHFCNDQQTQLRGPIGTTMDHFNGLTNETLALHRGAD